MENNNDEHKDVFELTDSEYILNLEFYLHRAILKWQDALESALRQDKAIDIGLVNRKLCGDMIEGIARAKGLIHWDVLPVIEGKTKDIVIENNLEAEEFKKKLNSLIEELDTTNLPNNIKQVQINDFKVFEILTKISKTSTKKGTVIV